MKKVGRVWLTISTLILLGAGFGWFVTRRAVKEADGLRRKEGLKTGIVDQRSWQTAVTLSLAAVTVEDQSFAAEAKRLADHEVDQAFAMALRQETTQHRVLPVNAMALVEKVSRLQNTVADDHAKVDALTATNDKSGTPGAGGDDLELAKAQLSLDQDELADVMEDLARQSGDKRSQIQQELSRREANQKKDDRNDQTHNIDEQPKASVDVRVIQPTWTLWGQMSRWLDLKSRASLVSDARQLAIADSNFLIEQDVLIRNALTSLNISKGKKSRALIRLLQEQSAELRIHSILNDRRDTNQQLATLYTHWERALRDQITVVSRQVFQSMIWIGLILASTGLLTAVVKTRLREQMGVNESDLEDYRPLGKLRKMRTVSTTMGLVIQLVGGLMIVLMVFGPTQQITTMIGFLAAGLTVVFQDYILAFFGWFRLMGKGGVWVGDWVEINSVSGEVVEIGLVRTTVLETGNWLSPGYPTGRKVIFSNSFAIRGQYFSHCTRGQWMWDELPVSVPSGIQADVFLERLQRAMVDEMGEKPATADLEWGGATADAKLAHFRAAPMMDLRPTAGGMDVILRFMTQANDRFEQRNRLFEAVRRNLAETEREAKA